MPTEHTEPRRGEAHEKEREERRDNGIVRRDVLTEGYESILREPALLTTVSVLLFGFLLSFARSESNTTVEQWLLATSMIAIAGATLIFVLPVAYHRIQSPYSDWDKFQVRAHNFIRGGMPLLAIGFYLSLCLAIWDLFHAGAFAIAGLPIPLALAAYWLRRARP